LGEHISVRFTYWRAQGISDRDVAVPRGDARPSTASVDSDHRGGPPPRASARPASSPIALFKMRDAEHDLVLDPAGFVEVRRG